jgi:serine/threonine protein kinase/Flp pilus assembly protein TadD
MIGPLELDGQDARRVDDFVAAFEAASARGGPADLADFLPPRDHPLYLEVLRELVRVDLELGWEHGRPSALEAYRRRFPELFQDRTSVNAIAFEEYRLRRAAGEIPVPAEYEQAYGASVTDWPLPRAAGPPADPGSLVSTIDPLPGLDALTRQLRGSAYHAQLVQDLGAEDPQTAQRLAEGLLTLPAVGDEFLGFRLVAELGRGAIGCVFLARQEALADRPVALKVAPALFGESHTLAQLQHTHIVPIHSVHSAGPLQAVCMPYFGRTTLAEVLRDLTARPALPGSGLELLRALGKRGRISFSGNEPEKEMRPLFRELQGLSYVEAVLWLGRCLADGLAHAHERGIVHRDLKPANVLITDEGQPMLLDFNLAEDTKLRGSAAGALVGGTLPYMAPEQLETLRTGKGTADVRADLFSLGVILYELLSGRPPFPVRNRPAPATQDGEAAARREQIQALLVEMARDRRGPPPSARRWNPAVSPAADAIVRRCLEPEPRRRYQSARALQEDLQRQLDRLPLKHTPEPSLRERARKWLHRHPRLPLKLLAGGTALLLGLALWFGLRSLQLAQSEQTLTARSLLLARTATALSALDGFREDLRAAQTAFNAPGDGAGQHDKGQQLAERALARFRVLDDPDWSQRDLPTALPPEERDRLRREVGELLLLLARGRAWPVTADQRDQPSRREAVRAALDVNRRAEACYPAGAAPAALWLQRADLHRQLGEHAEAQACHRRAAGIAPQTAHDHYLLAREHKAAGRPREAIALLHEATRLDPQSFWAWFLLGNCHDELSEDAHAVSCYNSCVVLAPTAHSGYFNRGLAHLRQKDFAHARADFDQVLKLKPGLAEAYMNRALARQGLGRPAEAVKDFTRALECGAAPTRVYFMRAVARRRAGDADGARHDEDEGRRREPADETSWIVRGRARSAADPAGALADYDRALALNPRSRIALQNKASVLSEKLNRPGEAIEVLNRLLSLYPDSVPARGGRGVVLARLGRRDAALEDARGCLARNGDPRTRYQVACIYALTSRQHPDDRARALQLLTEAVRAGFGIPWLAADHDLDPLRGTPEFQRLADAAGTLYGVPRPKRTSP